MSELGDKFAAARFGKKAQFEYGADVAPRDARAIHEIVRRRLAQSPRELREAIAYLQQLKAQPPEESTMPRLGTFGAGAGAALLGRGTHQRYLRDILTNLPQGQSIPKLITKILGDKGVGSTLAKSKLGADDLAKLISSRGLVGKGVQKMPDWLPFAKGLKGRYTVQNIPKALQRALRNPAANKQLRTLGRGVAGRGSGLKAGLTGGMLALGATYLPQLIGWAKNRLKHGPGGTAIADATQQLQQKLRNIEADEMYLAMSGQEMRQPGGQRGAVRGIPWNPFEAYRKGSPITLPNTPGLPGYKAPEPEQSADAFEDV